MARLDAALKRIDGLRPLVHAEAYLQAQAQPDEATAAAAAAGGAKSMTECIGKYEKPAQLAALPIDFTATGCKPILFDLVGAWSFDSNFLSTPIPVAPSIRLFSWSFDSNFLSTPIPVAQSIRLFSHASWTNADRGLEFPVASLSVSPFC